jgi:hypothetical protein
VKRSGARKGERGKRPAGPQRAPQDASCIADFQKIGKIAHFLQFFCCFLEKNIVKYQ